MKQRFPCTFHFDLACNKCTYSFAGRWSSRCKCSSKKKFSTVQLLDSDNVVFAAIIFAADFRVRRKLYNIGFIYNHLKLSTSQSKFLIISIVNKSSYPNKWLLQLYQVESIMNIAILQITVHANHTYGFQTFSLNPFTRKFLSESYPSKMTWFEDKTRNLQRRKITLCFSDGTNSKRASISWLVKLRMMEAIEKQTNMTTRRITVNARDKSRYTKCDMGFGWDEIIRDCTCSKMHRLKIYSFTLRCLLVPVLYDVTVVYNVEAFFFKIFVIVSLITTVKFFTALFKMDHEQWYPMMIFGMLLSLPNPREPIARAEYVMLIILLITGFFFGSDLISGLTSNSMVQEIERPISEIIDLRDNNLTVILPTFLKTLEANKEFTDVLNPNKILYCEYSPQEHYKMLIIDKNVSLFSDASEYLPSKLVLDKKLRCRTSGILISFQANMDSIKFNSPFLDRFSDIQWRFHEASLENHPMYKAQISKLSNEILNLTMLNRHCVFSENDLLKDNMETNELIFTLVVGHCMALIAVIVEQNLFKTFLWLRNVFCRE